MGNLTTVTIYNDYLHLYKNNPQVLGTEILASIDTANQLNHSFTCCGLICQPSYHSTDEHLYLHRGNSLTNINPWSNDMKSLIKDNPKLAESFIKSAEFMIKEAKKLLKEKRTEK